MVQRLRAAWIFPVVTPPINNGVVVVDGKRIAAVGTAQRLGFDEDLGDAALLPGFVNAHVHLDLSDLRGKLPPSQDFTSWLKQIIAHRRTATPAATQAAIEAGIAEVLASGTTCVGDIDGTGRAEALWANSRLRGVSFREVIGLRPEVHQQVDHSANGELQLSETSRHGLSPHAPYSTRFDLLPKVAELNLPVAMHLAEFAAEEELLLHHAGPLRQFLEDLGVWNPSALAPSWQAILETLQPARPRLLAHGNYLRPEHYPTLEGATVVYCPRTHAAFKHPRHPFMEMHRAGINVCLGTDGLSSNPDLDLWKEAQFIWQQRGDEVSAELLLDMATRRAAQAVGMNHLLGSLEPGKLADLQVRPLRKTAGAEAPRLLLENSDWCSQLLLGGHSLIPSPSLGES